MSIKKIYTCDICNKDFEPRGRSGYPNLFAHDIGYSNTKKGKEVRFYIAYTDDRDICDDCLCKVMIDHLSKQEQK
jgi:hypothetical protein